MAKRTKRQLQDELDRAVKMADRAYGVYSVDPNAQPTGSTNVLPPSGDIDISKPPPRNINSVEPGAPSVMDRVGVIPTATYDPIRAEGNWAPFRPVPEPIPGIVPGFSPLQTPVLGQGQWGGTGTPITAGFLTDLGEYNPEVYGRSAVLQYEKMRRGDAQVWATLSAKANAQNSSAWPCLASFSASNRACPILFTDRLRLRNDRRTASSFGSLVLRCSSLILTCTAIASFVGAVNSTPETFCGYRASSVSAITRPMPVLSMFILAI